MLAGNAAIYVAGLSWLATLIGFDGAVRFGLVPFVAGDLVKAGLAAVVFPGLWSVLKRR